MPSTTVMDRQRERKNLRTALVLGALALCSLAAFIYKIWNLG
jgi:hypothetical protein